jgi:hypothetical protein
MSKIVGTVCFEEIDGMRLFSFVYLYVDYGYVYRRAPGALYANNSCSKRYAKTARGWIKVVTCDALH